MRDKDKKERLEINLKHILTKSRFGPVKIGMTRNEVKKLLGKPTSIHTDDYMGFINFYYNWYEIAFFNFWDDSGKYKVAAFQNDSFSAINGFKFKNRKIKVNTWILKYGLTLKEACQQIDKKKMNYYVEKIHEVTFMRFDNSAYLGFYNDTDKEVQENDLKLLVIGYHPQL